MYRLNIEKIHEESCRTSPTVPNHELAPQFPGACATPFYITARTAPSLQLSFVIEGMKGEVLNLPVDSIDLAFLLEQTLKRKGWKPATIENSVNGFLDMPLMQYQQRGKAAQTGILDT